MEKSRTRCLKSLGSHGVFEFQINNSNRTFSVEDSGSIDIKQIKCLFQFCDFIIRNTGSLIILYLEGVCFWFSSWCVFAHWELGYNQLKMIIKNKCQFNIIINLCLLFNSSHSLGSYLFIFSHQIIFFYPLKSPHSSQMVKHNNVIPNNHFRKHWQRNVRVWLNQAQRKHRRVIARRAKAATLAPRPLEALRPTVRCQTIRYNHRPRLGKGFTLAEVKAAGLGVQFARSIGISVDQRRKNRNQESLQSNKNRLVSYVNRLVLFPRNEKAPVTKAKSGILNDTPKENQAVGQSTTVNALPSLVKRVRSVSKLELERLRKAGAYRSLRQEWNNQRNEGRRLKKEREAAQKN